MGIQKQLPKLVAAHEDGESDGRNNRPYRGQHKNSDEKRAYRLGYREGQLIRAAQKKYQVNNHERYHAS